MRFRDYFCEVQKLQEKEKSTGFYVEVFLLWRLPLHLVMMI